MRDPRRHRAASAGVAVLVTALLTGAASSRPAAAASPRLKFLPSITLSVPNPLYANRQMSGTATLAGGNPSGTITISLFRPTSPDCQTPATSWTRTVIGNGDYSSTPIAVGTGEARGLWRWQVAYSGDLNNAPVTTPCNAPGSTSPYITYAGEPTDVEATPVNGGLHVRWLAPADTGDTPITGYRVETYKAPSPIIVGTPASLTATSLTIYGLDPTASYHFWVYSVNKVGSCCFGQSGAAKPFPPAGPFASLGTFVDHQYSDLLARPPTAAERSSWVTALTNHTAQLGSVIAALRGSTDHVDNVDPVTRLYRAYFMRIPDPGGLTYWIAQKRSGRSLDAISAAFAASPEFTNRYGSLSNAGFLNLVYVNVLGRPGDQGGQTYWTSQLDQHKRTRGQVMIGFSESSEYRTSQVAQVTTAVLYVLMLGRAPTTAELSDAVAALSSSTTTVDFATAIVNSPEYATRVHH